MSNAYTNALGIDLGLAKVGLARMNAVARIPTPLAVIPNDEGLTEYLKHVVREEQIDHLVFGIPRNMQGEMTTHSLELKNQAEEIAEILNLAHTLQDETLSTVRAKEWQKRHGQHAEDDAIAACIILEDFAEEAMNNSGRLDGDVQTH